ncbi:MAG: hypothetical protein JW395_3633 [Nitrospira sp.]|nr:hypothetical protein [Nitrospira sp.]
MNEPRYSLLQQECQRLHCGSEHLFCFTPFWSILSGKQSNGSPMHANDPVSEGALKGMGSALTFQLIEVHKIPGESLGKLPKIVKSGPGQDSAPAIML